MYDHGETLKRIAIIVEYVGIAASVLAGIVLMIVDHGVFWWAGIIVALSGSLSAWVSSMVIYSIGDTRQRCHDLQKQVSELEKAVAHLGYKGQGQGLSERKAAAKETVPKVQKSAPDDENTWTCRHCGNKNQNQLTFCSYCGEDK